MTINAPMETCQMVTEKNPHPMDMTVTNVWVDDTVNFDVMLTQTLPCLIKNGANMTFDLCLNATDGMSHTAKISYETDMGIFTTKAITINAPSSSVSVNPVVSMPAIAVFPNPATSTITAQLPEETREGEIVLYSQSGQRVLTTAVHGVNKLEIPVGSVSPGTYYLRFESAGGTSIGTGVTISR